jgi:acyl-coenzyme A thioesterase PaaI-like protein
VKYLRPITRDTGAVRAAADVVHRGRRTATSEARLTSAATGELLATGTSTCLILER